ncbi:hypothetical protein [Paraburkholderia caffeinilytica]|uniref:hypothetical protein n=1 Tax=Paraburkholderia caffeinilytica TaxID=1761016 RepID=UPI003D9FF9F5
MRNLDIPTVCERIAVQPPYFAFSALKERGATAVQGIFTPEQQIGYERGPVSSAEIGRHLAILGSCAAVAGRPAKRTYYLATKACLKFLRNARPLKTDEAYHGVAEVLHQDGRMLIAQATASDDAPFAHLRCEYQALQESVFARVFKQYQAAPVECPVSSPYCEPISLDFDLPHGLSLTAHSRPLSASRFAGHFSGYPAWPVAILADTVSQVRSRLLHHILDREVDYTVVRVDLDASRLVPASDSLSFLVECVAASSVLSYYIFAAKVIWGRRSLRPWRWKFPYSLAG